MTAASAWPELSWTVPAPDATWLFERIGEIARAARGFELALEHASSEGDAPLAKVVSTLEKWDKVVAKVWTYAGLEPKEISAEEVPHHAAELEKLWKGLTKYRLRILDGIGELGAATLLAHEGRLEVTEEAMFDRVGDLPPMGMEVSALGVVTGPPQREDINARPVTADEMKSRGAAESKELPEPFSVASALGILPPPWVHAIFETLGLDLESADEEVKGAGARASAQRMFLEQRLTDRDFLLNLLFALEEEDRVLLSELVAAPDAGLRYNDVTGKYGRDEADGFYWGERPASGPLARLRRTGLVYVGIRRNRLTAALPANLVGAIRELLAA